MEKDDDIKDGDMIVTSNISGKFLPGILVGMRRTSRWTTTTT